MGPPTKYRICLIQFNLKVINKSLTLILRNLEKQRQALKGLESNIK